jgi:sodium transport system ATP-binding protein
MSTRGLRDHLRTLRSAGCCIVFSSHVMQEVEELCDHLVIVDDGIVKAAGSPAELCRQAGQSRLEDAFVQLIGVAA